MLLVDDKLTTRSVIAGHLRSWSVIVTEVGSGREAMALLVRALGGQYDAIVLNGQVADMDGATLSRAIRAHHEYSDIPMLIMNTVLCVTPVAGTVQKTSTAYLTKPVRRAALHTCLSQFMAKRSGAVPSVEGAEAQPGTAATPPEEPQPISRRRVLIVEDNVVNQEVARAMLQELDMEAISAWSR